MGVRFPSPASEARKVLVLQGVCRREEGTRRERLHLGPFRFVEEDVGERCVSCSSLQSEYESPVVAICLWISSIWTALRLPVASRRLGRRRRDPPRSARRPA